MRRDDKRLLGSPGVVWHLRARCAPRQLVQGDKMSDDARFILGFVRSRNPESDRNRLDAFFVRFSCTAGRSMLKGLGRDEGPRRCRSYLGPPFLTLRLVRVWGDG